MRIRLRSLLAPVPLVAMLVLAASSHAQLIEVTQCGQVLPARAIGYLSGDLDCSGFSGNPGAVHAGAAVYLGRRGGLDLRGFTLTAGEYGVLCDDICGNKGCGRGKCEIFGGGTVNAAAMWGIGGPKLTIRDVIVTGSAWRGVYAYEKLLMLDSTVTDTFRVGVSAWRAKIIGSTISGNGELGVEGGPVRIFDSFVSQNGENPALCDFIPCADIAAYRRPTVKNTACQTSIAPPGSKPEGQVTWGVCALD